MIKKLLKQNEVALLFGSTIIVNAGNYLINLLLGRFLGPAQFAEAGVMATLVLILSFLAVGLQLSAAKFSATYFGKNAITSLGAFQLWIYKKSNVLSLGVLIILLLLLVPISNFLHFASVVPLALIFIGIPAYFNMSVSRGLLQGTNRFLGMAFTYQAEMFARFFFTFLLLFIVLNNALPYASEAIGLGFLFSFLGAFVVANIAIKNQHKTEKANSEQVIFDDKKAFYNFAIIIAFYEFSQILINNSDVILVKHYFENQDAGLYAAVALIGRVVFFATWTIVTLLFPKVIQMEQQGLNHQPLFWKSLAFVFAVGAIITSICFLFDELIMQILFGNEFVKASSYLWLYAIATTLFACSNVFAYYFMSLNKYIPVYLSVFAGVTQIVLIVCFHNSLTQVIQVQIALMASLFLLMSGYFFLVSNKKH